MADIVGGAPVSKKAARKEKDIFDQMAFTAGLANECAKALSEMFHDLTRGREKADALRALENEADRRFHDLVEILAKAFMTPLDREDIRRIAYSMDDVIDSVEDIAVRFYMLNMNDVRPEAVEFSALIEKMGGKLVEAFKELRNFKKPKKLHEIVVGINTLEELGDEIYHRAVYDLFSKPGEPLEVMKWRELFETFERCCDSFEDLADIIQEAVMKNT